MAPAAGFSPPRRWHVPDLIPDVLFYVPVHRSHFRWILQKRWVGSAKYVHLGTPLYMNTQTDPVRQLWLMLLSQPRGLQCAHTDLSEGPVHCFTDCITNICDAICGYRDRLVCPRQLPRVWLPSAKAHSQLWHTFLCLMGGLKNHGGFYMFKRVLRRAAAIKQPV